MTPSRGRIVTFYSYKGGTGRSMAMANFAWLLAASGKRVLTIDWDLEAPGLHRYFRPFLVDPDLFETDGLIETFWRFAAAAMAKSPSTPMPAPTPALVDEDTLVDALEDATVRLDWSFATDGYIDFIGAGRQGATYSERVNTFDWTRFYEIGGDRILQSATQHLRGLYDWVLIDSRTGVSDTSGICTIQMPDAVVSCFTLNRQSIDGVVAVLRSIRSFRSKNLDSDRIDFYPIATRIENAEQARLETARAYARSAMAEFLPKDAQSSVRDYWDGMEITYRPSYAFEEVLAAFGDATGAAGAADTMLSQVEAVAHRITGDSSLRMPEIIDIDRNRVLARYALDNGLDDRSPKSTASADESGALRDGDTTGSSTGSIAAFGNDIDFLRGVFAKEQLWRTSGFPWRLLLSRRELDLLTDSDRRSFGRTVAYYVLQSQRAEALSVSASKGFVISVGMGIVAVAMYFFWTVLVGDYPRTAWVLIFAELSPKLPVAAMFGFVASSLVVSSMQRLGKDVPYGLRTVDALALALLGPLKPRVRDYENLPEHDNARRHLR
ncbi:Cellulose biosynthesis protein BcsQ [Variovorax sp. CF079]|uniref:KGGVGR-motif variant AAA ATPase n=1 Tax=Variovorax sp. CF079 TaxID=1882774 RepID=UPI0008817964|nr:hypothetical protein [Variovorax sp. CF079]SDC44408.1 Cellulose biosynthesis protein BcsQ [Variovorax sp. CF079]